MRPAGSQRRARHAGRATRPALVRNAGVLLVALVALALGVMSLRKDERGEARQVSSPAPDARALRQERRQVAPKERHSSVEARPEWSISGVVEDPRGRGLSRALVCAAIEARTCCTTDPCTTADASGRFVFDNVPGNVTALVASAPGHLTHVRRVAAPEAAHTAHQKVSLRLEPGGAELTGTVVDVAGGPIGGALVTARSGSEGAPASIDLTDGEGRFALRVPVGPTEIVANADGYTTGRGEALAPARGVVVGLIIGSALVGRVVDAETDDAVAGVMVQATNTDGLRARPATAGTEEDGGFRFEGLPAGSYELQVIAPRWRGESGTVRIGVGATSETVVLAVSPAATLSGSVEVAGERCEHALVELAGPMELLHYTEAGGSVTIGSLAPGSYRVIASCPHIASQPQVEQLELGSSDVSRVWDLTPVEDDSAPFVEPGPPRGSGSVHARVDADDLGDMLTSAVLLGESGVVRKGRPEGDELIFAELGLGQYDVYLEASPSVRQTVRLESDGQKVAVRLVAPPRGVIAGQVRDQRGVPLPDAWVRLTSATASPADVAAPPLLTDAEGGFVFRGPLAGVYTVSVESPIGGARLEDVDVGTTNLTIRVQAHGTLSGTVKSAAGEAVRFALKVHREGDAETQHLDGVGDWTLPWLAPGTYDLAVTSEVGDVSAVVTLEPGAELEVPLTVGSAR